MTVNDGPPAPGPGSSRTSTRTSATLPSTGSRPRLPDVWRSMRLNEPDESVVVVPSVSLDRVNAKAGAVNQAMEERYLFLLLLLRQPRLRMVYVTSGPVDPAIVEYYLALLPGVIPSHARSRLSMVSVGDLTPRPLQREAARAPALLADIAALIPNPRRSHLVPYTTTTLERDLAIELGIPMYGADPRHLALGTKSGCRKLFDESGVSYPVGFEDLSSLDEIVDALSRLRARRPDASVAMVKLNEGVSGAGNAVVDLAGLPAPGAARTSGRPCSSGCSDGARGERRHPRDLPRQVRAEGRDRRGADRRRRGPQPERPAAGHPAGRAGGALDARPDPRRAHGAVLPRLHVPGGPRVCAPHHPEAEAIGAPAGRAGRARAVRRRLRRRPQR